MKGSPEDGISSLDPDNWLLSCKKVPSNMYKMHKFTDCAKYHPGPRCSKLMMLLVNISLKL